MGRKPNPLILEYFVRGPKLNDNSNRYPHTCKQCGESFPKGRIDSLTTHITKKCPAISDSERMRACLELHGIAHPRPSHAHVHHSVNTSHADQVDLPMQDLPQGWSALETLAEASRQVDLNEHNRSQVSQANSAVSPANPTNGEVGTDRFELQEQFTLDNPPINIDSRAQNDTTPSPPTGLTPEERLQALLPQNTSSPDVANLSVAVAAAARMNTAFLDPDLASADATETTTTVPTQENDVPMTDPSSTPTTTPAGPNASQPWGEMTYIASAGAAPFLSEPPITPMPLNRGGVRMDTSDMLFNGRPRHARAQFSPSRRKEVQEVRKIGACIRCRILRKTCGKGSPCDTCRKVLSPRVWKVGCVRTKLHEQLDIYSAGVQVVLSQNRINMLKDKLNPRNNGTVIELSHFPDVSLHMTAPTLVGCLSPGGDQAQVREEDLDVIMIDQDGQDIPGKIEEYMRAVLPLLIEGEPSKFTRVMLETAQRELKQEDDEVLKKALELWGLVETIDRERQWTVWKKPGVDGKKEKVLTESNSGNDGDVYTMICMQVNAAAERRANKTSRDILGLMQRFLQDSKMKIGFRMYLTALILLNCVEKSTWAFKAWEQDHLRPGWPLEREPGDYTQQGSNLAGLLKMLLAIRKALPQTTRSDEGKLVTNDPNEDVVKFFESIDLDYDTVEARQQGLQFSPADSRSLELAFCSHLLLPTAAS